MAEHEDRDRYDDLEREATPGRATEARRMPE
jgi:hypothetical protein